MLEIGNVVSFILPLRRLKKGLFMATVKFDEGTKFETSLDLEEGEGVIFIRPPKNLIINYDKKHCQVNLVITNKRVVTIPYPKFSGKFNIVSFYFKDIKSVQAKKGYSATDESSGARFSILLKTVADKTNCSGDIFIVGMEVSIGNLFKSLMANITENNANNPSVYGGLAMMDYSQYTSKSVDKYYAAMDKAAKDKAAGLDFSKAGHAKIRDYIVDLIAACVEEVNK